jgi:hypothetical protein
MRNFCIATVTATLIFSTLPTIAKPWEVEKSIDKMSGESRVVASLESNNMLSLPFPYNGPNSGFVYLRQRGKSPSEVAVGVSKGQLMCRSYSPCTISVKFDNGPIQKFEGSGTSSGDSTVTFLSNPQGFIKNLKKSKSFMIQIELYKTGKEVLEFSPDSEITWPNPTK